MATTVWQCSKCGTQKHQNTPPGVSSCKNGGNHVWTSMARFINVCFNKIF